MMAEKNARRESSQAEAVAQIREGETFALNLPVIGQVEIPRPEALAYYGGIAALAAFELIDWPGALVIAAGHLFASNHHNKLLGELGEGIEDAEERLSSRRSATPGVRPRRRGGSACTSARPPGT